MVSKRTNREITSICIEAGSKSKRKIRRIILTYVKNMIIIIEIIFIKQKEI